MKRQWPPQNWAQLSPLKITYAELVDSTAHAQAAKLDSLFAGLGAASDPMPAIEGAHYPNFSGMNKKAQNAKSKPGKAAKGKKKRAGYER